MRIAIVRALPGLGDFLTAVPAMRALGEARPEARLDLIGLPSAAAGMVPPAHASRRAHTDRFGERIPLDLVMTEVEDLLSLEEARV